MNRAKTPVPRKEMGTGTRCGEHPHVHWIASVAGALWLHSVWLQSLGVGLFSYSCIEGKGSIDKQQTQDTGYFWRKGLGGHGGRYVSIC